MQVQRLRELARRIVWESDAGALAGKEFHEFRLFQRDRLDGCADLRWRTLDAARAQLVELRLSASADQTGRLDEIAGYLDWIAAGANP